MALTRVHLIIRGRVQGVAFRYATKDMADVLSVSGFVRNRRQGTVEAVAEGERAVLDKFVKWCHQGPPHARVIGVEVDWEEPTGEFDGFKISWTV